MLNLLSANEKLSGEVSGLKSNRGVKIDEDQFVSWTGKIDELRLQVDEEKLKTNMLIEENGLHLERIDALEEELRRMRQIEGDMMGQLEKERNQNKPGGGRKDSAVALPKKMSAGCQTKHSGSLPEKVRRPVLTSISTQSDSEPIKEFLSAACNTDEVPVSPRSKKAIPPPAAGEMDKLMVLGELNEIRKVLESATGDSTASVAWNEVCNHGVLSAMSAVKQRAIVFRNELEICRRQLKKNAVEATMRRMSTGNSPAKIPIDYGAEVEFAAAPNRLMSFDKMDARGQEPRTNRKTLPAMPMSPTQSKPNLVKNILQSQRKYSLGAPNNQLAKATSWTPKAPGGGSNGGSNRRVPGGFLNG
jgi:hypothetical protein